VKVRFEVIPDEGDRYRVTADGRDFLAWERAADEGEDRSITAFVRVRRAVDVYELAWLAVKRKGLFTGPLHEFEKANDVEAIGFGEEEPDPSQSAATAD
jgi:hypothetical protein